MYTQDAETANETQDERLLIRTGLVIKKREMKLENFCEVNN